MVLKLINEVNPHPETIEDLPEAPISMPKIGSTGKTGNWRTFIPIIDYDNCINCKLCWLYCPEGSIFIRESDDFPEIDYDYCKGCGVCAQVCPKKCIDMKRAGIELEG